MPRALWPVIAAMAAFALVVGGVLAWAALSGSAGSQRGLVVFNEREIPIVVTFADGQSGLITPQDERTFVLKRGLFPSDVVVRDGDGALLHERPFEWEYFAEAEFRISFDERGFYPTATYRDPPPTATP